MAEAGEIRLSVSDDILTEVERVLQRPKFGWTRKQIDDAIRELLTFTEHRSEKRRVVDWSSDVCSSDLSVSDDILTEVERVLQRPKFGWTRKQIDDAIRELLTFTEHVEPKQRIDVVKDDPTDNRILDYAIAERSEYLITGDKHLLKLREYGKVKIVTPATVCAPHCFGQATCRRVTAATMV